jgi:hypothetical protein
VATVLVAFVALFAQAAPPALVLGGFKDDYNTTHSITATRWVHGSAATYEIVEWNAEQKFFIAKNGPANPSDPGKWSRVDWVEITSNAGQVNYEWAYCMSAYDAPTEQAARAVTTAKRDTPRTGCNGFPFTRMARVKF